ncbi:PREDICTED: uncharacterized protein LOC104747378 [Camelina sativa]|uniref:Uncharacterized protein LOC104747378 n=1 Tax=Camelina sativa TaxID=90675 RepID=A0ABM0W8P8_CAMSA|nr:PREDICTED: uncharacterized protein LOC104747378 [Camelina sativa]
MDIPMVITKWSPYAEETQPALKSIPLWVTLTDVPPSMFTHKGLQFLASAVGKQIRLHPKIDACTSFDVAQILVEADLTKSLSRDFVFTGEEEGELDVFIKYSYPWLPPKCEVCGKWGHHKATCLAPSATPQKIISPAHEAQSVPPVAPSSPITVIAAPVQTEDSEVVSTVALTVLSKEAVVEEVEDWTTPKSTRSPGKHQANVIPPTSPSILSNAFSALSDKEEVEDEIPNDVEDAKTEDYAEAKEETLPTELGTSLIPQLRPSLPRGSKTAHKIISNPSTQPPKTLRDQKTRVKERNASWLGAKLFKDWSVLSNYEHNARGRIWVVWRNNVCLTPVYKTGQLITCSVKLEEEDTEFFSSFVYASNLVDERKVLWEDLRTHRDSPLMRDKPWIIFGDFNETLALEEHSCGANGPGPLFTWRNKRENDLISKKLDRVLINEAWLAVYPQSYTIFEAGGCSDHSHCRINLVNHGEYRRRRKPFKFVNAMVEMPEFRPLVEEFWGDTEVIHMSSSSLFRFTKKLKALKPQLKSLARSKVDHLVAKTKEAYTSLCEAQELNLSHPSAVAMEAEKRAYDRWSFLASLEEKYLKQKSKLHCLQVGDRNNKTFHRAVQTRAAQNVIREILKPDGSVVSDEAGSDGYTSEFFKAAWDIIGVEFVIVVQSFFEKGFLPKGANSTILALIPKKLESREMKDYRPISCCNVIYKVISKILANRLKLLLPQFIAGNQSAFVKDRLLIENVLLATELVKDYHKDSISSRCAIKIDISKAFDSVQWPFLRNVLETLDLPPVFVHWIMLCVTTASFSVQMNGELAGFFQNSRGLRQGCSLSPYLFVIIMDVLSKMLDKAVGHTFGYHPKCKNLGITHLSFADDLMVLSDGKEVENSFSFEVGQLPVRYLGLPLVTKRLSLSDCAPLIEQLKKRIGSWTARFLSFAGRLNLIQSVLWSVCNFWCSAFRLPRQCTREIDSLCSAFLWSGPELNPHKAKVTWEDICKPKTKGGLALRSLKEMNDVCCLKLIWRIVSSGDSLWVKWVENTLLKQESFWGIKSTAAGSWMWRKILKYRGLAAQFCRKAVNNGSGTSFWYDNWSTMGRLVDVAGDRGIIDMGISNSMTVAEAWSRCYRRTYRLHYYTLMEAELSQKYQYRSSMENEALWKGKNDKYYPRFSTKDTWNQVRTTAAEVSWYDCVWFSHSISKFSFCTWLAVRNKLSTGDRMAQWSSGDTGVCVLCNNAPGTRDHLFFSCAYSSEIWGNLASRIFGTSYSTT